MALFTLFVLLSSIRIAVLFLYTGGIAAEKNSSHRKTPIRFIGERNPARRVETGLIGFIDWMMFGDESGVFTPRNTYLHSFPSYPKIDLAKDRCFRVAIKQLKFYVTKPLYTSGFFTSGENWIKL